MSGRSYILLSLTTPTGTAKLNHGVTDSASLGIQRVICSGLTQAGPAFISFSNWATSMIIHGTNNPPTVPLSSQRFLLPMGSFPVSTYEFEHPVYIMGGDNQTSGIQEVSYEITDGNGTPLVFTRIDIWLECVQVSRNWSQDGDRRIDQEPRKELVERNKNWTILHNPVHYYN